MDSVIFNGRVFLFLFIRSMDRKLVIDIVEGTIYFTIHAEVCSGLRDPNSSEILKALTVIERVHEHMLDTKNLALHAFKEYMEDLK